MDISTKSPIEQKIGEILIYPLYKKQYKLKVVKATDLNNPCNECFFNTNILDKRYCAQRKRYITGECQSVSRKDNINIIFKRI